MYKPTEEELLELGFKEAFNKHFLTIGPIAYNRYESEGRKFMIETRLYPNITFYPESLEDIKTLIRLFKLK